jgi:hypothetical protein
VIYFCHVSYLLYTHRLYSCVPTLNQNLSSQVCRLVFGSCEHGNEPSGSVKCCEFLDWMSDCSLPTKPSVAWSQIVIAVNFQKYFSCADICYSKLYSNIFTRFIVLSCVSATISGHEALPSRFLPFVLPLMSNIWIRKRSLQCTED